MTGSLYNFARRLPGLASLHAFLVSQKNALAALPSRIRLRIDQTRFDNLWERRIQRLAETTDPGTLTRPIIHLYATCRNEEKIIPYFIDHYSAFVQQFYIFDNCSTDTSVERLSRHKHVTVIPFETGGQFDEGTLMRIRNNEWKKSRGKADFVIVCDMDEILFHPRIDILLHLLHARKYTLVKPTGYNMTSMSLPEFDGSQAITQLIRTGIDAKNHYSKTILFSPTLDQINYSPGSHKAFPEGRIKRYQSSALKLLHYKFVDRDNILRKTQEYRNRMSESNKAHGWGRHYMKTDDETLAEFDRVFSRGHPVI